MGKNIFTNLSESILTNNGQAFNRLPGNLSQRIIYPAIVREVSDGAGYNRIKAEIVNLNAEGQIYSGRDKDLSVDQMPLCIPLLPEYLHVRPQVGECVLVLLENPNDPTSARYYIGPLITQQTKLNFQNFESSQSIYNKASFKGKNIGGSPSTDYSEDAKQLFASQNEIAFQGRNNGDLVIGDNLVKLRAGIFKGKTFKENKDYPSKIELKIVQEPINSTGVILADNQINNAFEPFSYANITASNINLISPEGKFRSISLGNKETGYNPRLNDFGDLAKTLHPAVLGDELVNILYLIINYLFTHIHPPQSPSLPNNFAFELEKFRSKDKRFLSAQILSNSVRLN